MTAIRTFIGRQNMTLCDSAVVKIMSAYLASYLTAIAVLGFFFVIGLFDGGIFSGDSLLMQLLNR